MILKLLKIIYHRYTHKQVEEKFGNRVIKTEKEKQYIAGINNEFITNLITRKVDGKLLLYKLVKGLDGEHFQTYVYFIWKIWKSSSYADINPETNKLINITEKSPVLLDYRSDKKLGFYTDNANINWEGKNSLMDISVIIKTGELEEKEIEREDTTQKILVEKKEKIAYQYHPFSPVVLVNSENPKFILKEGDDSDTSSFKLPAFVLFANNETAFWQNVLKGSQYLVDIITTVSGVGNILKAGRIYRLLKNRKTLLYKTAQITKAIGAAKAAVGVIDVSAGTVNVLLKLIELDDAELGKTISKYLFYLEMLSLAGEATVFLKDKLSKTAKELVENPKFTESLDDLVKKGEIDEVGKTKLLDEVYEVAEVERKLINEWDNGRLLSKRVLKKRVRGLLQEYKNFNLQINFVDETTDAARIKDWNARNVLGSFRQGPPPKLFFRKQITELTWQHEIWHLEDLKKMGSKKFYDTPNWKKEELVWERVWKTKGKWTEEELLDSYVYYKKSCRNQMIEAIKIGELEELLKKQHYINRYKR